MEQRVICVWATSMGTLVDQMNALLGSGLEDGSIVNYIEHFDVVKDGDNLWCAFVLMSRSWPENLYAIGESEAAEIEARQEWETAIGVKPR